MARSARCQPRAIIPKIRWRGCSTASRRASRKSATAIIAISPWRWRGGSVRGRLSGFCLAVAVAGAVPGRNFFPAVDAGAISLHVRAPVGTRIEETAALFDHIEKRIRQVIPPTSWARSWTISACRSAAPTRAYLNTGGVGPEDGDILISLNEDHAPTADYVKTLRTVLPQSFPGSTFSFLPADIVSQILNFGSPAPIDVQVAGPDKARARPMPPSSTSASPRFPAPPMCGWSNPRTIPNSAWTWTAPAPARPASPSGTSPTAWWSIWPAASRWRRPSGSIPRTASPIPS